MISSISSVYSEALEKYKSETPEKLKLLDLYMVFCVLLGVLQAVYLLVVGTYPYNAFLAGFGSAVASFVLSVSIPISKSENQIQSKKRR